MNKISWVKYFFEFTKVAALKSSCLRRKVGAIAVKDKRILATGYNGSPTGMKHCSEIGCLREQLNVPSGEQHQICRAIHAEENLLVQASYHGISLKGCDIYCTTQPCSICIRKIISLKPKNLYYIDSYPDKHFEKMISEVAFLKEESKKYKHWIFE